MNRLVQSVTLRELHLNIWVLAGGIISAFLCAQPIAAQVISDGTLPVGERSQVTGNPNFQIDGGARRGGNLFHSFSQFSVPTGGSAYFNNAANVQNIFSRVTGESVSNIDGLIRANGRANLFLLNPNGILFGPNASLNIGGSFVGTTADAIGFPNGEMFSSDAAQPLPSHLLSINPNVFLFNQLVPQTIINQSTFNEQGLQVPTRENLLLVGGQIQLDGGRLISPGSHVELGSVGEAGTVGLSTIDENWRLDIPNKVTRADISLRNGSPDVSVEGDSGSSIRILAQNIEVFGGSLRVGVLREAASPNAQTGDLELNATGSITITDTPVTNILAGQGNTGNVYLTAGDRITITGNRLLSTAEPGSIGNVGDVTITAGTILFDGTVLVFNTSQQTDASNIFINARDRVSFNNGSLIFNAVEPTGIGNGGDINITTGSLVFRGASMFLFTLGQGNVGSVNINARDTVFLDGGLISNTVESTGIGNAGGINIATGSLTMINGAQMVAGTFGQGNASNITITARDRVSLDGESSDGAIASTIFTRVELGATGQGGDVNITTGSLFLTNGGAVNTANVGGTGNAGRVTIQARDSVQIRGTAPISTINRSGVFTSATEEAVGSGGNVTITTGSLSVSDQGRIITNAEARGNAGNIQIQARDAVLFDGGDAVSTLDRGAVGRGGDIEIEARSLTLLNGAQLSTSTRGQGNAGNVTVNARDTVSLTGANRASASVINTRVEAGAVGDGGQIEITSGSVSLTGGAQLATTTLSQGRAGNISINAEDRITISGTDPNYADRVSPSDDEVSVINAGSASGLYANTEANSSGTGGVINLTTESLSLLNSGRLVTSTAGQGNAGDITVNSSNLRLSGAASGLFAQTATDADAGNLTIQPQGNGQSVTVQLQEGAQISASTSSSGRGGQLTITAPDSITLTGSGSIISAETGGRGTGGNLTLQAGTLNIQDQAEVTVSSSGQGRAGSLVVEADRIFLNNGGRIRADTSGGGGNISLRSPLILLRNGSNITTNATGANIPGGNIDIDTAFLVAVPNEDSNISANSEDFRGGNVSVDAIALYGIQPSMTSTPLSDITATGATSALPGTIDVTTATIDPTAGLVALPTDLVDASQLVAQGCPANEGNTFVVTGRGGLPPTPEQQLDDNVRWGDRRRLVVPQEGERGTRGRGGAEMQEQEESVTNALPLSVSPPFHVSPSSASLTEATRWQTTPTGEVILVADVPNSIVQDRLSGAIACNER